MQKLIDETGNKYGLLTVIEPTRDKNNRAAWLCKCECGNTKIVRGSDLREGKITSCGRGCKLRYQRSGVFKDETGKQYGRLTVLYRAPYKKNDNKVLWHCRCSCGNECDVRGADLRSGKIVSCGCYKAEQSSDLQFKDETGHQYGYLTVLSLVKKSPEAIWLCKCKCGNLKEVSGQMLRNGNTKSCGCLKSWYEEEIATILNNNNVNYSREVSFSDLISGTKHKLRFDFGIYDENNQLKGLIEYQGKQHFEPINGWGGQEGFERLQKHDNMKKEYCKQKGIPLLILDKNNNLGEDVMIYITKIFGGIWDAE